ncbi:alpha/beta fold hydrolase [Actinomadura macrotermitis]|uniref:Putative aminoacrylate hydrolase RutD n=1 Tax=Actinomadura macrotermitis TaxID=2585200 RepID=A0A7K0BVU8_9ACTN|nr:alpha/beta hydrolase [Actinomadura macrotermitis]MQY04814.1 putative aminoacrylate hydrolase RutD [Actinomadura macrotermitis]
MAAAEVTRRWDRAGPFRVRTRTLGDPSAPAVVLVPGLGLSGAAMVPLMRRLAGHRVLAPDLPGIGASDRPDEPLGVTGLADALIAWMDAVGLPRAALVGHSLGAQVVAVAAGRHPGRVSRLVLAGPNGDPRARTPPAQAGRLLLDAPREAPSLVPLAVRDYLCSGPWRMWRTLRLSSGLDLPAQLRRVPHRTLVVRGGRDPVVTRAWAEEVARLLPDGTAVTLPGAPHGVTYTTAGAFAALVRPFLSG